MLHPPSKEAAAAAISVIWDIKRCPVRNDQHARRVGPCIKWSLRRLGYSGPITITAVGVLTQVPEKILEAVYSTGISLYTGPFGRNDVVRLLLDCPRRANVMVISRPQKFTYICNYLKGKGCNIILPFPFESSKADVKQLWKKFLADPEGDKCSETGEPASWICAVCDELAGRGFENFITHLSTQKHKDELPHWFPPEDKKVVEANVDDKAVEANVDAPAPLENISGGGLNQGIGAKDPSAVAAISVFWDIKWCPVPDDCDARWVGPCIKRFLRKLGYSGPITITAVGELSQVPDSILEAVSSTGISLYNSPYGPRDMVPLILDCFIDNPPPASIMLISRPLNFSNLLHYLEGKGCNLVLPFPFDSTRADAKCLWKNFILADPGELEDNKCSETGEPASWVCAVCDELAGRGFGNFITHLSTQEHKQKLPHSFPEGSVCLDEDEEVVEANVDSPLENATNMA